MYYALILKQQIFKYFNDRHIIVIKTRNHVILSTFLLITLLINTSVCQDNTAMNKNVQKQTTAQQFDVELPSIEKPSRKKRMRKSTKKEAKQKKVRTYLDMEHEQLVKAKDAQKAQGNTTATIKYLEQLLKMTTDITLLAEYFLELADTFFDDRQFAKSALLYSQYCALYPGSEKQEYALYKTIASSFECILAIDRDQSKTEETLALTELFLKQDHFKEYQQAVSTIQQQCYQQLAASECNICVFYLHKGSLKAAEKRLHKIRSFWLPKLPTLEPDIIALETELIEQKKAVELLNAKNMELAQNAKAKHMANRF